MLTAQPGPTLQAVRSGRDGLAPAALLAGLLSPSRPHSHHQMTNEQHPANQQGPKGTHLLAFGSLTTELPPGLDGGSSYRRAVQRA